MIQKHVQIKFSNSDQSFSKHLNTAMVITYVDKILPFSLFLQKTAKTPCEISHNEVNCKN